MMADFTFSAFSACRVLWKLRSSAFPVNSLPIKKFKETMSTVEEAIPYVKERRTISEALGIWLKKLDVLLKNACDLLDEIECEVHLRNQGSAGRKLCRFFSSSNPLVFCFRIGHRIEKMRERFDRILVERERHYLPFGRDVPAKPKNRKHVGVPVKSGRTPAKSEHVDQVAKTRASVLETIARIDKLNDDVTYSFFRASEFIGLDEDFAEPIVCMVACIVGVCVDPFFLYIPFLSLSKMCLGMNRVLWKVAVVLRTVADFFTLKILFIVSMKSIVMMCVKYLALAPIPQILFSEKFILKTLGGYTFWNLSLFCQYGTRLVLIFRSCEQLKKRVSVRTLVWLNASVYLILYLLISHVIGASWYYLSIKQQLSRWNYACKIETGCIFHCDGTNSTLYNQFIYNQFFPIYSLNAAVFDYGIYLDALQSRIVEEEGVLKKFCRCIFWGLRNLSSFASNLHTSTNDGETFFAIIISGVAWILLIYIIGIIQRYSELGSARSERIVDKMEPIKDILKCLHINCEADLGNFIKKLIVDHIQKALDNGNKSFNFETLPINHFLNDVTKTESLLKELIFLEEWVLNGQPDNLGKAKKWMSVNNIRHDQNNILFYLTCRLKDDEDVNLTSVLSILPDGSKWMTMKDLCFDTLKKVSAMCSDKKIIEVPGRQNIDEEWFKSMRNILKPVIYPKESYIFRQGKPLDFIIFITNGIAWCYTTSTDAGGRVSVSINSLEKGHFFGAELLKRKLDKISESESDTIPLSRIPISTADVKAHTQVEAFVLMINDLALSSDFPVV